MAVPKHQAVNHWFTIPSLASRGSNLSPTRSSGAAGWPYQGHRPDDHAVVFPWCFWMKSEDKKWDLSVDYDIVAISMIISGFHNVWRMSIPIFQHVTWQLLALTAAIAMSPSGPVVFSLIGLGTGSGQEIAGGQVAVLGFPKDGLSPAGNTQEWLMRCSSLQGMAYSKRFSCRLL